MRLKRKIKIIFKYLFWAMIFFVLIDSVIVLGFAYKSERLGKADAIVVMGAAINSPAMHKRVEQALTIYDAGLAPVLVLAGGKISEKDMSEARYMQKIIKQSKINPPPMLLDELSNNTLENITNAKKLAPQSSSAIIVTDKYHLARSIITARFKGFKNVYWSAPGQDYYPRNELIFHYFREIIALPKYAVLLLK